MPGESTVLVRLRLLGANAFAAQSARASESMVGMGRAAEGAAAKIRGVGAATGTALVGLGRLAKRAALPLGIVAFASGKMAMDFQQSMLLIHTQAGASAGEVKRLSHAVLDLAKIEPQSPKQLADALYRLEGAGLRGKKAMTGLKAAADLAAVGNANVEDTAKTLSQVWFSGIPGAQNLQKVVAEMNATVGAGDMRLQQLVDALGTGIMPVAKNAGLRMRDITGVLAVFGDETNNVSGWTAQLATALHYLYAPGKKSAGAMASIGLSGSKLGADFRKKNGLLTALRDLHDHLDKLPGGFRGIKASQTLSEILPGGRGRVMNVLLGQLDRYQGKLKQIGGTSDRFGEAVRKTHETAAFKVHAAWSTIQVAMIQLGGHILPLAANAFTAFAGVVDKAAGAMERFGRSKAGGAVKGFVNTLGGGRPKAPRPVHEHGIGGGNAAKPPPQLTGAQRAGLAVRKALGGLFSWMGKMLPVVGRILLDAGKRLIDAFKPAMPFISNVLLPLLKGIAEGVIGGVVVAFNVLVPVIKVVASVLGFVGKLLAPLKGVFEKIGMAIGFLFGGPILKILGLLPKVGIVFRLLAIPLRVLGGVFRVVGHAIGGLVGFVVKAWGWFRRWVGFLGGLPGRVGRIGVNIVGGIVNHLEALPGKLWGLAKRAGSKLAGGLGGMAGTIFRAAKNLGSKIISGIVNFIKGAPNAVKDAVLSVLPGPIKSAVSSLLGDEGNSEADQKTAARKHQAGPRSLPMGHRKLGGPAGGLTLVGEAGPEVVDLPDRSFVHTASQTRRMARQPLAAGGGTILLTANLHMNGKQIHSEVFKVDRQLAEYA